MQQRFFCEWIWRSATVLCDGTVTCGLDDPFKQRSYGNLKSATLRDIMQNRAIHERRERLVSGSGCSDCTMYRPVTPEDDQQIHPSRLWPKRLVIETSIRCNIRCANEVCSIANDATIHLRREDFLQWPIFTRVLDEAGPHLEEIYFYNYGEPFVHPKALDMLAYAKAVNPHVRICTSTNGVLLAREGIARRIVEEGLLEKITFTIGGVDPETYDRYHKSSSFSKALAGMRAVVEEKTRLGRSDPHVYWRYLLFNWNDADEHIETALAMKEEIGVDSFEFFLTGSPMEGRSLRRAPGTAGHEAIKPWLGNQEGYDEDPLRDAGLWGVEQHPELGAFSWTGTTAAVGLTTAGGHLNLRLSRPDFVMVSKPIVEVRTPWGATVPAVVGVNAWADNLIAVPPSFPSSKVYVDMDVTPTFSPARHLESMRDNRVLGVMVSMEGATPRPNPYRALTAH